MCSTFHILEEDKTMMFSPMTVETIFMQNVRKLSACSTGMTPYCVTTSGSVHDNCIVLDGQKLSQ